jgi:hypothetical protein
MILFVYISTLYVNWFYDFFFFVRWFWWFIFN